MKTNVFSSIGVALAAFMLSGFSGEALVISDTAGTWRVINFSIPNRLTLQRDTHGVVIGISEANNFERSTGSITVQPNGNFSGSVPDPVSGTMALGGQGELILNATGGDGHADAGRLRLRDNQRAITGGRP